MMAETPREIKVHIAVDTTEFEAAMRRMIIGARKYAWHMGAGGAPRWKPWSWYATSERAS